jgi:plastocyanin
MRRSVFGHVHAHAHAHGWRRAGLVQVMLLLWAPEGLAATVTGTVSWAEPRGFGAVAPARDPEVCGGLGPLLPREVAVDDRGRVAGALVFVEGAGAAPPASQATVVLEGCRFTPRIMVLGVGSTVRFRSRDPILHNVTLEGPDGAVLRSATLVTAGQVTPAWPLAAPGHYRVRSRAGHTWMNAHLWVHGGGAVAVSTPGGGFTLEGVPAGPQRVLAWHPDLGLTEADVVVKTATAAAQLYF